MGADKNTYLGPYLRVVTKGTTQKVTLHRCSNTSCRNHNNKSDLNGKFCADCGSSIESYKVDKPITIGVNQYFDRLGKFLDHLAPTDNYGPIDEGADILLPNTQIKGCIDIDMEGDGVQPLEKDIHKRVENEINLFNIKFAEHLDVLRKFFGEDKVTVHWGVVVYYS